MEMFVLAILLMAGISIAIPSPIEYRANTLLWTFKISLFVFTSAVFIYQFRQPHENPLLKEERTSQTSALSLRGIFGAFLLKSMKRPALVLMRIFPGIGEQLLTSGMSRSPQEFFALVLVSTIAGLAASAVVVVILLQFNSLLGLVMIPVGPIVFGFSLLIPKMSASKRAGGVDAELTLALSFISILASGGISPMVTLRRLAEARDLFPAMAKEAEKILMETDIFGRDPLTTFDKVGRQNPNKALADFFAGYTSVVKTGGDIVNYIESKLRDVFAYKEAKLKALTNLVGILAEAYMSVTVVLGISITVIFGMEGMLKQGGTGGSSVLNSLLFSTVVVPLLSIMFIYLVHSSQPQEPGKYNKPYAIFGISLLALPAIVFLPFPLSLPIKLGFGLALASLPPAILYSKFYREKSAIEGKIPDFILDLAEVRRTGLTPERGIQYLADRNYGKLSKHIQSMSAQLSWGVSLNRVMLNLTHNVKSWTVKAVGFLVSQVVEVGGGTVKMFVNLAEFTQQMGRLEKEKRSSLRPYAFIPYLGAILVVGTSLLLMSMLGSGAPKGGAIVSQTSVDPSSLLMLSGAVFQAWVMGFVAGKMGEGSLAAGFRHACALAAICSITIYIAALLLALPGLI